MKIRSKKRGFSLGEILVAVAIVAVLAAVVLPSIGSQLNKGDNGRVESDLTAIQSGIQQFLADVRRYPASLQQLFVLITTSDKGIDGVVYTTAQVNRWRGPYVTKDTMGAGATGFGQRITATFVDTTVTAQKWMMVVVPGIDTINAVEIDAAMDDGKTATGQIRWTRNGAASDGFLKYFALPRQ
jgi:prepilin-type N-terminal cleavage/methylation domain-containing protein